VAKRLQHTPGNAVRRNETSALPVWTCHEAYAPNVAVHNEIWRHDINAMRRRGAGFRLRLEIDSNLAPVASQSTKPPHESIPDRSVAVPISGFVMHGVCL
jgi:hypothetical protein